LHEAFLDFRLRLWQTIDHPTTKSQFLIVKQRQLSLQCKRLQLHLTAWYIGAESVAAMLLLTLLAAKHYLLLSRWKVEIV